MNKNSTNSVDTQISSRKYSLSSTDSHNMEANLEALHLSGFGGLPLLCNEIVLIIEYDYGVSESNSQYWLKLAANVFWESG